MLEKCIRIVPKFGDFRFWAKRLHTCTHIHFYNEMWFKLSKFYFSIKGRYPDTLKTITRLQPFFKDFFDVINPIEKYVEKHIIFKNVLIKFYNLFCFSKCFHQDWRGLDPVTNTYSAPGAKLQCLSALSVKKKKNVFFCVRLGTFWTKLIFRFSTSKWLETHFQEARESETLL